MQGKNTISTSRLERSENRKGAGNYTGGDVEVQMNHLTAKIEELQMVTRLQRAGIFSSRPKEP